MTLFRNTKGSSLAISVGLIALLVLASAAVNELIIRNLRAVQKIEASNRAFYAAEAALEDAFYELTVQGPGYETGIGPNETYRRTSDFGTANTSWTAKWSIEAMSPRDENNTYNTFKGKILPYQKVVVPLYKINVPSAENENAINTDIGTTPPTKFYPTSITFSSKDESPLVINNDLDSYINQDGASNTPSSPPPHTCTDGKTYSGKDDDCDNQEDEDSREDPVILWRMIDDTAGLLLAKKGCLKSENPFPQGSQICEKDFESGKSIPLTLSTVGFNDAGEPETISVFIGRATSPKLEFSIIAPLINSLVPANPVQYDYLNYEINTGGTQIPTPYYTLKVDGKYNDYVQSITTTLLPQTTSPLLDFTIVQQSTASTFSETELNDLFSAGGAAAPGGGSGGGSTSGGGAGGGGATSGGTPSGPSNGGTCPNGILNTGEECDDGNAENTDACLNNCKTTTCGDNVVYTGIEICDDGNSVTETCDYGARSTYTICNSTCQEETCEIIFCGDGITNFPYEECDDSNINNGDGCSDTCQIEAPVANNDGSITVAGKEATIPSVITPISITPLTNDTPPANIKPGSLTITKMPDHGVYTLANDILTFTPTQGYQGPDTIKYTIKNTAGTVTSNEATITINIEYPKIAFLSVTTSQGGVGINQMDGYCQADAYSAGSLIPAGKNFKTWISTRSFNAKDRIIQSQVPYILPTGEKIANNFTDLTDGTILIPINKMPNGVTPPAEPINLADQSTWAARQYKTRTITDQFGNYDNSNYSDCNQLTSSLITDSTSYGDRRNTGIQWTDSTVSGVACIASMRTYCFEAPPIFANDDSGTVIGNRPIPTIPKFYTDINILNNDTTSTGSLDQNSITIITNPTKGTITNNAGVFRFTPNDDQSGSDSFTYIVKNTNGDISNMATVAITINKPKIAFLTKTKFTGNLGGVAGADTKCQTEATTYNITSAIGATSYKAWISDNVSSPSTRFTTYNGPYITLNGKLLANSFSSLINLNNPLNVFPDGTLAAAWNGATATGFVYLNAVFTGTLSNGTSYVDSGTCFTHSCGCYWNNGTVGGGAGSVIGDFMDTRAYWTDNWAGAGSMSCDAGNSKPLYCFEQ